MASDSSGRESSNPYLGGSMFNLLVGNTVGACSKISYIRWFICFEIKIIQIRDLHGFTIIIDMIVDIYSTYPKIIYLFTIHIHILF